MSTENKYDYDATREAFKKGHIFDADVIELRKYLSGVTADGVSEGLQERASRMANVVCYLIDSHHSQQNYKENMDSIAESRESENSATLSPSSA